MEILVGVVGWRAVTAVAEAASGSAWSPGATFDASCNGIYFCVMKYRKFAHYASATRSKNCFNVPASTSGSASTFRNTT